MSLSLCVRGHAMWPICTAGNGPLVPNRLSADSGRRVAGVPVGLQIRILQTVNSLASTCPAACCCLVMTKCELIYIGYDVIVLCLRISLFNGARSTVDVRGPSLFFFWGGGWSVSWYSKSTGTTTFCDPFLRTVPARSAVPACWGWGFGSRRGHGCWEFCVVM